jgi:hypothetical protein
MTRQPQRLRRLWQWSLALAALLAGSARGAPVIEAEGLDEAQRATLEQLVTEVSQARGLDLVEPLRVSVMTLEELQGILMHQLNLEYTEGRLEGQSIVLQTLGVLPPGYDIKSGLSALLMEQIGGLYDDETRRLCVMEWINLNSETARLILAHEITHALQDQHFHLAESPIHAKGNDDRAIAALAMLEGDAMITMSEVAMLHGGVRFFIEMPQLLAMDQRALLATPPFIQGQLFFPYLNGQSFLMRSVLGPQGRAAADQFMTEWPESTEQLLHPERSAMRGGQVDRPTPITLDAHAWGLPEDWTLSESNVLGEFALRQIFQQASESDAEGIAAGWDGDRWEVWRQPESGLAALLWSSVWDTPQDAREFALALRRLLEHATLTSVVDPEGRAVFAEPRFAVVCRGATVHAAVWNETGGVTLTPPETTIDRVE